MSDMFSEGITIRKIVKLQCVENGNMKEQNKSEKYYESNNNLNVHVLYTVQCSCRKYIVLVLSRHVSIKYFIFPATGSFVNFISF
jgi:hypothetical protein